MTCDPGGKLCASRIFLPVFGCCAILALTGEGLASCACEHRGLLDVDLGATIDRSVKEQFISVCRHTRRLFQQ